MRSTDVSSTRCCRWKLRGVNHVVRQVIVLLVCILSFLLAVVHANHIHQLDSNLVDDGSISANPLQKNLLHTAKTSSSAASEEEENWIDKERIQLRHNFTFRVNGRELALEPPNKRTATTTTSSASSSSSSSALAPKIAKKVNRVGDSLNDYESGFEPNDSDQSLAGFEAAPASHSSALMSSSPSPPSYSSSSNFDTGAKSASNYRDKDYDSDREVSNGGDKSRRNLKQRQRTGSSSSSKQTAENDNKQSSRIISDWPKSLVVGGGGREQHSNTGAKFVESSTTADRHSSWSQNNTVTGAKRQQRQQQQQLNSQLVPKYSALLSSKANTAAAANELASQSGEPSQPKPRWDNSNNNNKQLSTGEQQQQPLTGRIKLTISSKLAQTIKQPPQGALQKPEDSSTDQSSGKTNKRGSSARKQTMRAPVHARQHYLLAADKASTTSKSSPTEPETISQENSNTVVASKPASSANSTKVELSGVYELPSLSISEHKTNFSATSFGGSATPTETGKSQLDSSKRTTSGANKSNIVQRDLTRANLLQPSDTIRGQLPLQFRFTNDGSTFPAMAVVMSTAGSGVQPNTTGNSNVQRLDLAAESKIGRSDEHINSIVRTGPILTHPLGSHNHLSSLVPAAMALLAAQAQDDQHSRSAALRMLQLQQPQPQQQQQQQLQTGQPSFAWGQHMAESAPPSARSSAGPTGTAATAAGSMNDSTQLFSVDQMIATANHLGVAHLGPQPVGQSQSAGLGASETSNYGSMADYTDRLAADANLQSSYESASNSAGSSVGSQQPNTNSPNISGDEQRYPYSGDPYASEADQNQMIRSHPASSGASDQQQQITNSRSSMTAPDHYMRAEGHKGPREAPTSYTPTIRGSIDPFEELTGGLSASDYERDLADLDEEFSRHTAHRRPQGSLMSDSYVSLSPERYEARRFNRRPSYTDYGTGEYLSAAGSMSSIIPRAYARTPSPWASSSPYSESSDLWSDTSVDYSPIMSPSHYAYRWRPRYQRIAAYPGSAYLAAAASEQQIPAGYNILPAYSTAGASVQPTETISFALSPLAAAAAAAASALAAADKSRHQSHAWLTLPRLTQTSAQSQPSLSPGQSPTASASSQHAATVPASLPAAAAYLAPPHRPGAYALSPIPIYAFAPRPQTSPALAAAAGTGAAATPAMIPYFHGATPTLLAYRTAGMLPASSLLTAASFAYPFRMPITATSLARPPGFPLGASSSGRPLGRPYLTDLQYAETKYKTNMNNSNNSDTKSGFAKSSSTLSAMAKNLSKKVFGSASQLRPQHVAPPTNAGLELYSPAPSTALANLSQSIIK